MRKKSLAILPAVIAIAVATALTGSANASTLGTKTSCDTDTAVKQCVTQNYVSTVQDGRNYVQVTSYDIVITRLDSQAAITSVAYNFGGGMFTQSAFVGDLTQAGSLSSPVSGHDYNKVPSFHNDAINVVGPHSFQAGNIQTTWHRGTGKATTLALTTVIQGSL